VPTPTETAEYVQGHLSELAAMCRSSGLNTLAYLIEIAKLEATLQSMADIKKSYKE
jgi:hypothetical protein